MNTVILDGVSIDNANIVISTAAQPPGPQPVPQPVPQPTPQPTTCGPNEVFAFPDADWSQSFTPTQIFPATPLRVQGPLGRAVQFVADAVKYPNGITITLVDQSPELLPKVACISECPHSFVPVNNQPTGYKDNLSTFANFDLRFGTAQAWYDCVLVPGKTYYLNFRGMDQTKDAVAQFSFAPK